MAIIITDEPDPPRYDWRREVEAKRPEDDPARDDENDETEVTHGHDT